MVYRKISIDVAIAVELFAESVNRIILDQLPPPNEHIQRI